MSETENEVLVQRGHYISGMPAMDEMVTIAIRGICIQISQADYEKLAVAMESKASKEIEDARKMFDKWQADLSDRRKLLKDIRSIFYTDCDGIFLAKEKKDIDMQLVEKLLDENAKLLGFE